MPRPFHTCLVVLTTSLLAGSLAASHAAAPHSAATAPADTSAVGQIRAEAAQLRPWVRTPLARAFLDATASLPHIATRTVLYDSSRTHFYWLEDAAALPESAMTRLVTRVLDESFYYTTRYGTPLAYSRPLDLLSRAGSPTSRAGASPTSATAPWAT